MKYKEFRVGDVAVSDPPPITQLIVILHYAGKPHRLLDRSLDCILSREVLQTSKRGKSVLFILLPKPSHLISIDRRLHAYIAQSRSTQTTSVSPAQKTKTIHEGQCSFPRTTTVAQIPERRRQLPEHRARMNASVWVTFGMSGKSCSELGIVTVMMMWQGGTHTAQHGLCKGLERLRLSRRRVRRLS